MTDPFPEFFVALEARHRADLTFAEVRRGLTALSSIYVERRLRVAGGAVFDGAGKRAAFALYYGAFHFGLVREIVRALGAAEIPVARLQDLGCGTGAPGAAWALEYASKPALECVDHNAWAVREARWTLARLRLTGRVRRAGVESVRAPGPPAAILAAFTLNELQEAARGQLLARFLDARRTGVCVLAVEPLSRRIMPWWEEWAKAFRKAGGREDEWRFPARLPEAWHLLGHAAGLDTRDLTGRSLWLG